MNCLLVSVVSVLVLASMGGVHGFPPGFPRYPTDECLLTRSQLVNGLGDHILALVKLHGQTPPNQTYEDCAQLYKSGYKQSGVYDIYLVDPTDNKQKKVPVFCDMDMDGGGWTVIQRRIDGTVDFFRNWADYKKGFGNVNGEYWLGNDNLNRLTRRTTPYKLRVDLEEDGGKRVFAAYSMFAVAAERQKYKLSVGTYSGNAGDSLTYHKSMPFSTKDRDNDPHSSNCAQNYKGGWWYNECHYANLNGEYLLGSYDGAHGIEWYHGQGAHGYSYKRASMMLRPTDF